MHDSPKRVIIGIQARSTSKRLPGKIFAIIGAKTVLRSVVDSVAGACFFINQFESSKIKCTFCLVVPYNDPVLAKFKALYVEGPEDDVLTRYKMMADRHRADYVVRITADCPLIPSPIITRIIKDGVKNDYDYFANFFEDREKQKLHRLVPDGFECEFFSKRMLDWADENAKEPKDREHVTTFMRSYPSWGKFGVIVPYENRGEKKLSVDTQEDLDKVRMEVATIDETKQVAEKLFGKNGVHRH